MDKIVLNIVALILLILGVIIHFSSVNNDDDREEGLSSSPPGIYGERVDYGKGSQNENESSIEVKPEKQTYKAEQKDNNLSQEKNERYINLDLRNSAGQKDVAIYLFENGVNIGSSLRANLERYYLDKGCLVRQGIFSDYFIRKGGMTKLANGNLSELVNQGLEDVCDELIIANFNYVHKNSNMIANGVVTDGTLTIRVYNSKSLAVINVVELKTVKVGSSQNESLSNAYSELKDQFSKIN